MTVRRDLDALAHEGRLVRTHGGAMLSRPGVVEFAFQARGEVRSAEKRAIAAEAAALVRAGMSVSLDTGTTTLEVARAIAGIGDVRVLTSSLAVASALYAREGVELVLLGGVARKGSPDLQGEITEENLKRFSVDLAFLGADALSEKGLYTTDPAVARVSRAMMESARRRVVVADSSKFDATAFIRYAGWGEVDILITDSGANASARRLLKSSAKRVIYARA